MAANFMRLARHSIFSRWRRPTLEAAAVLGVLALLALLQYAPALLGGKSLLLRDLHSQFYGPRCWYRDCLRAGALPSWNSYILCGSPFLANPQNEVFYPFTLLFAILPVAYTFAVFSALHSVLLGFFLYLLGRTLGLSFWGAFLAGIAAGFAGIPLKLIEFPEMAAGFAWTPLVLLGAWKCLTKPSRRASALLGAALGLQFLAGSPYPPFYSAIGILCALTACGALHFSSQNPLPRPAGTVWLARLAHLAAGLLLGALIGCAQYIPTLLLISNIPAEMLSGVLPLVYSLRLRDILHLVSPWLSGYPNWQKCFYLGMAPLFLAIFAVGGFFAAKKSAPEGEPRPSLPMPPEGALFCLLMILCGWLLAQSGYLQLDELLDRLPLVTRATKWPSLGMSLVVLALALLAGAGLDHWFDVNRRSSLKGAGVLVALVGLFALGMGLAAIVGDTWLMPVREYLYQQMVPYLSRSLDFSNYPLAPEAGRLALCGAGLAAILLAGWRGARSAALKPAVCLLVAADLLTAWTGLNFYSPVNLYDEAPDSLQALRAYLPRDPLQRVAVPKSFFYFNGVVYGSRSLQEFRTLRDLLIDDILLPMKVFTTHGGGSLQMPDYEFELQPLLDYLMQQKTPAADRELGAWNIGFIMENDPDPSGKLHYSIRANDYVLPRARLLKRVVPIGNEEAAIDKIARGQWDPSTVLAATSQTPLIEAARHFPLTAEEPGNISRINYQFNRIEVDCDARSPCLLVLAENWSEGWSVRVDATPAALYRVNFLQQAALLPPGEHRVVFHYTAPGAKSGLLLAGLGILGVLFCAVSQPKQHG